MRHRGDIYNCCLLYKRLRTAIMVHTAYPVCVPLRACPASFPAVLTSFLCSESRPAAQAHREKLKRARSSIEDVLADAYNAGVDNDCPFKSVSPVGEVLEARPSSASAAVCSTMRLSGQSSTCSVSLSRHRVCRGQVQLNCMPRPDLPASSEVPPKPALHRFSFIDEIVSTTPLPFFPSRTPSV